MEARKPARKRIKLNEQNENQTSFAEETLLHIFSFLTPRSTRQAGLACKLFQRLSRDNSLMQMLPMPYSNVPMLALANDQMVFAARGGGICVIQMGQTRSFKLLRLENGVDIVNGLAKYADQCIVALYTDRMCVWNVETGQCVKEWSAISNIEINLDKPSIGITSQGEIIISDDYDLYIFNLDSDWPRKFSYSSLPFISPHRSDVITHFVMDQDDCIIGFKNLYSIKKISLEGDILVSQRIDITALNSQLLSGTILVQSKDKNYDLIHIIDRNDLCIKHTIRLKQNTFPLHFVADEKNIIIYRIFDKRKLQKVAIWDMQTWQCTKTSFDSVRALTLLPDGRIFSIGGENGNEIKITSCQPEQTLDQQPPLAVYRP